MGDGGPRYPDRPFGSPPESSHSMKLRDLHFRLALALFGLCLQACAGAPSPRVEPLGETVSRVPVILVPGVTGTKLVDSRTGRVEWGTGWRLMYPRNRAHEVALPIDPDAAPSSVERGGILEEIRIRPFRKPIYGPIGERLERHGWVSGDPESPDPRATYYPLAYDWRLSNVTTAALLRETLEQIREARGEDTLTFDLICQSNGGHICRYLLKYGGEPLEEAEAGRARLPDHLRVRKVILVGASNGGSLRIFRMLDRGRRYLGGAGRLWSPETMFTLPSFFQDLPTYRDDVFVNLDGEPLTASLWDPEDWVRYGWSVFDAKTAAEIPGSKHAARFGDETMRRAWLEEQLDRARRFQRLLAADLDIGSTRYYVVEGPFTPTADRAVLVEDDGGWRTLFLGDPALDGIPSLTPHIQAPGDDHATVASVWHLSPRERAAVADEPLQVDGGHFEIVLDPATLASLVRWLSEVE